jgi:MFS family permease
MHNLPLNVLRIPGFRLLLSSRICVLMALQAQAVIVGWQVYSITKSPLMLGLTGLAEAVPAIACAFFAGHIVDSSRPRKIYALCLIALLINTAILLYFAGGFGNFEGGGILIAIFSGIILSGFIRSFIIPSSFALLPMIVKREDFSAANSWQTAGHQCAFILGPTIGGLLYGAYGAGAAWMFPVIMMVLAVIFSLLLRIENEKPPAEKRPPALQSIKEGWVFLLENRTLLSVMALDMLAVLFGGAIAMLPAFADQVLNVGAEGLGALRAAPAIGAIVTALYFALKPMRRITAVRLLIVVAGFGLSMIGFGASTSFYLSLAFLALSGAFDSVSMVIRSTLTQILTPDHMKGRVSSVNSMFVISSNELGALQSGLAAAAVGLVPSVILGGIGTLLVVGFTAALSPKFRKLNVET